MHPDITSEARASRRARSAILHALSSVPALRDPYVLKGGLALHLAFGSPRISHDIDLNAAEPISPYITDETNRHLLAFARRLNSALDEIRADFGFSRLATKDDKFSEEIPTLLTHVAYTSSNDDESGTIELQLTLSEVICETTRRTIQGMPLHVASVEDILAEKLKALLQQITRDKVRSADVFDIWYFSHVSPLPLDADRVANHLIRKSGEWDNMPPLAKSQFRRKSVVAHSAAEYERLPSLLPESFVLPDFREIYACVLQFVDELALPVDA